MTLAEFRGLKRPTGDDRTDAAVTGVPDVQPQHGRESAARGERAHPGPVEYVKIGLALAIVTAVEVAVYYWDAIEGALVPILLSLSALKFSLVALWFMHLRFDNRLFSAMFVGGLMLAMAIFIVVLATLGASLV